MKGRLRRERVPVRVFGALQTRLSVYAMAAGAAGVEVLASAHPVQGEVVYTPAHDIIGRNQSFAIDLNHDGIADFTVNNQFTGFIGHSGIYAQAVLKAVPYTGGSMIRTNEGYDGAAAIKKGASIGPKDRLDPGPGVMASQSAQGVFGTYSFGAWFNVSNEYLGFRFKINGEDRYGWARLTVTWNHKFRIGAGLNGYAYETEPNTPIIAGDEGSGSAESGTEPMSCKVCGRTRSSGTLGELAMGDPGLSVWRREWVSRRVADSRKQERG
jgi:hypothetical protein